MSGALDGALYPAVPAGPAPLSPFSTSSSRRLPQRLPAPKTSPVPQYMANKAAGGRNKTSSESGASKKNANKFSLNLSFNKEKDDIVPSNKQDKMMATKRRASGESKVNRTALPVSSAKKSKLVSNPAVNGDSSSKAKSSRGKASLESLELKATEGYDTLHMDEENSTKYLHDVYIDESVENDEAVQHALETLFVWDELDGRAFRRLSHEGITVKHLQSIRNFATPPRIEKTPCTEHDENSPTESFLRQNGLDRSPLPPFPQALVLDTNEKEFVSPKRRALREIQSGVVPISSIPFAKHDKGSLTPPPPAKAQPMGLSHSTCSSTPNQKDYLFDETIPKKQDFSRLPPNSTNTTRRRGSLGGDAEAVSDTVLEALKEYLKRQHADLLIRKSPTLPHKTVLNPNLLTAEKSSMAGMDQGVAAVGDGAPRSPHRADDLATQLREMTLQLDEIIQKDFNIDSNSYEDAPEVRTAPQSPFDIVARAVSPSSPTFFGRGSATSSPPPPPPPCTPPQGTRTPGRTITPKTMPEIKSTTRLSLDPNDWTEMCVPNDLGLVETEQSTLRTTQPAALQLDVPIARAALFTASETEAVRLVAEDVPVPRDDEAVVSVRPFGYGLHGYIVEALLCGYMTASVIERPQFEGEGRFVVHGQLFLEAAEGEDGGVEGVRSPDIKLLVLKSFEEFVSLAFDIDMNIDAYVPEEFQEQYLSRWLGDVLKAFRPRPALPPPPPTSSPSTSGSRRGGAGSRSFSGTIPAHSSSRGTQAVILKDFFVPSHC